jgi:hypothetical protein
MRMKQQMIKWILLMLLFLPAGVKGQAYRMELGLVGGSSFYMGDANSDQLFANEQGSFGVIGRYNLNGRFALKGNLQLAGIAGTTVGNADAYIDGMEISFDRRLVDATVQMEMGFYEYGVPRYVIGSSRVCPYVSVGLGLTGYKSDKSRVCLNMPISLGVKAKVMPRVNMGVEWSFRKTFADDLDYSSSSTSFQLNDSWAGSGSSNKNKDWYSILQVYITYDLYGIGSSCYR